MLTQRNQNVDAGSNPAPGPKNKCRGSLAVERCDYPQTLRDSQGNTAHQAKRHFGLENQITRGVSRGSGALLKNLGLAMTEGAAVAREINGELDEPGAAAAPPAIAGKPRKGVVLPSQG